VYTLAYQNMEYQYTLYYYDQAGNLTRTVPPAGVVIDRSATWKAKLAAARAAGTQWTPAHQMATEYRYNSLNAVISKKTPDDSIMNYWYDKLGRMVVSQNVKQAIAKNYSYTNFDALGRPVEVGEITSATPMTSTISRNEQSLANWLSAASATRTQIVSTNYDVSYGGVEILPFKSNNARNRVSWSGYYNTAADIIQPNGFANASFYSYDIHGNVDTLLQFYKEGPMYDYYNGLKKIVYQYDLISGKANFVAYQSGQKDAFYHRYSYDAENRLTNVETSHDSIYWENDAYYEYYKHGPLARAVIGQQQVQGIDYAYTLQGWLKGINSTALTPLFDIGTDGSNNSIVAKDAFGFSLHYFGNRDYSPVNTSVKPFAAAVGNSPLFNGNISAISQNISTINTPLEYTYSYDVLNRLTGMIANKGMDSLSNSWTNAFTALPDFKEAITYDGNGNILTYNRNGNKTFAGSPLGMDSMTYHYRPGTNKLTYVTDLVRGANYGNDVDNQSVGNYKYDSIGNMVSDVRAGVDSIKWNVYGKIAKIFKHDSTSIAYTYDGTGNRISKAFTSKTKDVTYTFYVRDATGNILSVYAYNDTAVNSGQLSQIEANLYGSSRLGMTTLATNVQDTSAPTVTILTGLGNGRNINFTRGKKFFELTNHLDNVLATVSDKKIGVSANSSTIDSYNPVIVSAQEYYPFGMLMPGRGGHIGTGRNVLGSTVVMNGDTVPSTLTVSQRAASLPATYTATAVVSFEPGFESAAGDQFTTMIVDQTSTDPGTESGVSYGVDAKGYRYGFNGKENDNEVKGEGNEQDYGMRVYDGRVGKFLSVDPITGKYPELTPYQFASNRPVQGIDLDGEELKMATSWLAGKAKAGGHPILSGFINSFGSLDVNAIMYNRWKILLTGDIEGAKKEAYGMTGVGVVDNGSKLVKSAYNGNEEAQGEIIGLLVQIAFSKRLAGELGKVPPADNYKISTVQSSTKPPSVNNFQSWGSEFMDYHLSSPFIDPTQMSQGTILARRGLWLESKLAPTTDGYFKSVFNLDGYKYEVRTHPPKADASAPAGSNSATGIVWRINRKFIASPEPKVQGAGMWYIDKYDEWHHQTILRSGANPAASNDTHIPINEIKSKF
jgi:RHS repeat-associated protein